ncbi:hypothetical protein ACLKA7_014217 [Drosophila subpalustris]
MDKGGVSLKLLRNILLINCLLEVYEQTEHLVQDEEQEEEEKDEQEAEKQLLMATTSMATIADHQGVQLVDSLGDNVATP